MRKKLPLILFLIFALPLPLLPALSIDDLTGHGVKIVTGSDGNIREIDLSACESFDFPVEPIDPTLNESLAKVRIVRGRGDISGTAVLLRRIPKLTELLWSETTLASPAGATGSRIDFEAFTELKKIRLTGLTDKACVESLLLSLGKCPSLVDLDLSGGTAIDNNGWSKAIQPKRFGKLNRLNLYNTKIGNEGVATLLPLGDRLVWLNLDATAIDDGVASSLKQLPKLEFLHLGRTAVTDKVIDSIGTLTKLKTVHVTRTQITANGVEQLQKQLPNTEIISVPAP